jgi:hypothetical protein
VDNFYGTMVFALRPSYSLAAERETSRWDGSTNLASKDHTFVTATLKTKELLALFGSFTYVPITSPGRLNIPVDEFRGSFPVLFSGRT